MATRRATASWSGDLLSARHRQRLLQRAVHRPPGQLGLADRGAQGPTSPEELLAAARRLLHGVLQRAGDGRPSLTTSTWRPRSRSRSSKQAGR